MSNDIIRSRLSTYTLETIEDEEDALKEILQEIILYGLSCGGFFSRAAFQGGTALRILHKLPRFSEDLDFILKQPDPEFNWRQYIDSIIFSCRDFGVEPEVIDKSKADQNIQKLFLKDNSIGKLIDLNFKHHNWKKLRIKLEIDINPPMGSTYINQYVNFPLDFTVLSQDLESNFAGKCHALLCRKYIKGRDWYDLTWYTKQDIKPNLKLLANALIQHGPWQDQSIDITKDWLLDVFSKKIQQINWDEAKTDVMPFLNKLEKRNLDLWSEEFFIDQIQKTLYKI